MGRDNKYHSKKVFMTGRKGKVICKARGRKKKKERCGEKNSSPEGPEEKKENGLGGYTSPPR